MSTWPGTPQRIASPVLETARLRLRLPEERDLDALAALYADADTMRYIGTGTTLDRQETWRSIGAMMGHWLMRGYGMYVVELKASAEVIGRIGYLDPEGWPGFELGWMLSPAHRGRGYAIEGARAAHAHAREAIRPERVISLIRPQNAPSMRVAEKLGMRAEPAIEFKGVPVIVYADHPRA